MKMLNLFDSGFLWWLLFIFISILLLNNIKYSSFFVCLFGFHLNVFLLRKKAKLIKNYFLWFSFLFFVFVFVFLSAVSCNIHCYMRHIYFPTVLCTLQFNWKNLLYLYLYLYNLWFCYYPTTGVRDSASSDIAWI